MKALMDISLFDVEGEENKKVEYLPSTHEPYFIEEEELDACSKIAGMEPMYLAPWANKLGRDGIDTSKYLIHTGNCGTVTHEMVSCHIAKKPFEPIPEMKPYLTVAERGFEKFLQFRKDYNIEILFTEIAMLDKDLRYGGKIDLFAQAGKYRIPIDLKPQVKANMGYKLQLSGYWNLCRVNLYEPSSLAVVLGCTREEDEDYKIVPVFGIENIFEQFKKLLEKAQLAKEWSHENAQDPRKKERKEWKAVLKSLKTAC